MDIRPLLSEVPLFEGFPDPQLDELAAIAEVRALEKGREIFAEGEPARGLYIVGTGQVRVFKMSPEGKEQILHVFGPGEPIGEVAVFAGRSFPAYAETMKPSELLFFPRDRFVALIQGDPALALNMLAVLSRRLVRFAAVIEGLSLREVPARLAGHLEYLRERQRAIDKIELDMPKTHLANLLGTTPETLSRILGRMTQEEIIAPLDNRRIRILDRETLRALAAGERRLS
jgi:CRP/FNR family transcriptional regulator, dissimilatory nitrate respiration regulator